MIDKEFSSVCFLPSKRSAHAKLPINKCVGERRAKSIHKAIKTSIFPRIVNRIIIDRQIAIKIVNTNGRVCSITVKSCADNPPNV